MTMEDLALDRAPISDPHTTALAEAHPKAKVELHWIALQCLFETMFPPEMEAFLDPSLIRGPNSAWCIMMKTKISLMVVCKTWRNLMLRHLYTDIVLRRFGQLSPLLRTLQDQPSYAPLVRSIKFAFYLFKDYPEMVDTVSECGAAILDICTNVHSISFTSAYTKKVDFHACLSRTDPRERVPILLSKFLEVAPRLKSFAYNGTDNLIWADVTPWSYHDRTGVPTSMLLASFPNLTRLKISIEPGSDRSLRSLEPLIFERLEEIYIWHLHVADAGCSCHHLLGYLRLPQLRALSLRWLGELGGMQVPAGPINQSILSFLQRCGPKLIFLDLSNLMNVHYWRRRPRNDWLAQVEIVASACPNLRHLVLNSNGSVLDEQLGKSIHSRSLSGVDIDVWTETDDALRDDDPLLALLPRIRILDHSLSWIQDLPRLFSPMKGDWDFNGEPRRHNINGVIIAETPFAVYRDGLRQLTSWESGDEGDDSDDPDYTTEDAEYDWSDSSSEWDDDEGNSEV